MKSYFTLSKYNQESPYLSPKYFSKSFKKINPECQEIAEQNKNKEISLKCFLINDLKKLSKIDKKFNLLGQKCTNQKVLSKAKKNGLSNLDDKCQIYLNQIQLKLYNRSNQKNQHESNLKNKSGIAKLHTQNDIRKLSHQALFRIYNKYGVDQVYQNIQGDQNAKLKEPKKNKKNKKNKRMLIDQKLDEIHSLALQKLNEEKYIQSKVQSKNKPRLLIDNYLIDRIVFEESMEQDSSEDSIDLKKQRIGIKMQISQSHESENLDQQSQKNQINTRDSEKKQSRSSPITIIHTPITQEENNRLDQNGQISDLKDYKLPQQKQKQSFQRKNLKRSQTQYQQLKRKQLTIQNYLTSREPIQSFQNVQISLQKQQPQKSQKGNTKKEKRENLPQESQKSKVRTIKSGKKLIENDQSSQQYYFSVQQSTNNKKAQAQLEIKGFNAQQYRHNYNSITFIQK